MEFDSILVSTTEVCTIGCRHCGFTGTSRDREPESHELASWVSQACGYGIPEIIFTGGEPFQRFPQLRSAVAAAAAHAPPPGVATFTSSFWGRTPASARRFLDELPGLTHLFLSTDLYHQEKVPTSSVRNVIEAALERGISKITLCLTIAEDWEEEHTVSQFADFADKLVVHVERVIPTPFIAVAFGRPLAPDPANYESYCYLDTPLINPNGDVSACHIGKSGAYIDLSEQVYFLGNLRVDTFADIMDRAEANYEYQFLRAFGPQGVARMIGASKLTLRGMDARSFTSGCDLCYKVLRDPEGRSAFQSLLADPDERQLVDDARLLRFGERRPRPAGAAPGTSG